MWSIFCSLIIVEPCQMGVMIWLKNRWISHTRVFAVTNWGLDVLFWIGIMGDRVLSNLKCQHLWSLLLSHSLTSLGIAWLPDWISSHYLGAAILIFMHNNSPPHASKRIEEILPSLGFKEEILMKSPTFSPDLRPIENLWNIIKYES